MTKVVENVERFLCGNVDDGKKFLTFCGEVFGEVCFKHRVFLGDFLSLLLFCSCCDLTNNVVKKREGIEKEQSLANYLIWSIFMDIPESYGRYENELEKLISIMHVFTRYIGMKFGWHDLWSSCYVKFMLEYGV